MPMTKRKKMLGKKNSKKTLKPGKPKQLNGLKNMAKKSKNKSKTKKK